MTREECIERMAVASARKIIGKQYQWTEEQVQAFCYSDPYGVRHFAKIKKQAAVMYDTLVSVGVIS